MARASRVVARAHPEIVTVVVDATMALASVAVISMIVILALMPG